MPECISLRGTFSTFPARPGTPEPVLGRKHSDVQTDSYLEELTGLAEMKRAAEGADCAWDGSDGEMSGDDW